jgi:hypothetical protein
MSCYHFLPSKYQLKADRPWSIINRNGYQLTPTKGMSPLKTKTFASMKLDIYQLSDEILSIFLWNPMLTTNVVNNKAQATTSSSTSSSSQYDIKVYSPNMFIEVRRRVDNRTLFSTSRGALIASENYFEWSLYLGNVELMGFDAMHLREGQRILINNEHSSFLPYVVAYGT